MTDKEYILALQQNDEVAFTRLYESCRGRFFGYVRKAYNKNEDYIADLYQDSCVVLWQNVRRGKLTADNLTSSLETYLIGVAKFTLMARDRKYREILNDPAMLTHAGSLNEESLRDEFERDRIIQSTVQDMEEPCSTLLDKYYWEDLSGEEIAGEMNYKNAGTVKTQKYKCMQKLKTVLVKKIQDFKSL